MPHLFFADIEEENFGLEPKNVNDKISKKTKMIFPMDYGGNSCKISELKQIAEKNNLVLIEDAAESLGSSISGKKVGNVSDSTIFSFCGNKVLTTGEGGAIVTDSKEIYEKIKLIRSHGRTNSLANFDNVAESEYVALGYNWRMSSITAALGISQLAKLDKLIQKRKSNANFISSELSKIDEIKLPSHSSGHEHIYQMYTIRLKNEIIRDQLHDFLVKKRIFSKVYFYPIHLSKFYKQKFGTKEGMLPKTEEISQQVLSLPMYPNMELEEKQYLVQSIQEFFEMKNSI